MPNEPNDRDNLRARLTSAGLIAPLNAPFKADIKADIKTDIFDKTEIIEVPEPSTVYDIFAEEDIKADVETPRDKEYPTATGSLESRLARLEFVIHNFSKEIAEFRTVHISRRGISGPQGIQGPPGQKGERGAQGESITGLQGIQGPPGRDSTVSGPQGLVGPPGSVKDATEVANEFVQDAIQSLKDNLVILVQQELQRSGVIDKFGKAVLIPGPPGLIGPAGRDGKDSVVPGPPGLPGRDGKDSVVSGLQGIPGRDGKDSVVPGPEGLIGPPGPVGLPGRDGKDSIIPGPAGKNGRDGVDGKNGIDGMDGKDSTIPGPPGNIHMATRNAERIATETVLRILKEKKLID